MMPIYRRIHRKFFGFIAIATVAGILAILTPAHAAENFPSKPITVVIHAKYGGGTDTTARMIPIMGRFMMHPDDAAFAAKLLKTDNPNLKTVVPQHFRVKGAAPWMGTPKQFEAEVKKLNLGLKVLTPKVGQVYTLSK